MTRSTFILVLCAVLFTAFTFTSCKKKKLNKSTTTSADNVIAESSFDDVFTQANKGAAETQKTAGTAADTCWSAISEINSANTGRKVTITFKDGCTGTDGRMREGQIIVDIIGTYREEGSKWTITPVNYKVDNYAIEGSKTVENMGKNTAGNTYFNINVDGTVTTPAGEEITWNSARVREWIEGEDTHFLTPDGNGGVMGFEGILDDAYSITGTASGTNREGRAYAVEITTPLRVQFCGWIPEVTQGILELSPDELDTRIVDYGDATCDNKAMITVGNFTKEFNLR